jgi:nucleoside-diphosphate-sugar epimerase
MASPSDVILVTGANGFTGRRLVARLRREGATVVTLGREAGMDITVDLADDQAVRDALRAVQARQVVHLAGLSFAAHTNILEIYQANLTGSINLLQGLSGLASAPERILMASSAAIYAASPEVDLIRESHPLGPSSHYGASKAAMEQACAVFAQTLPVQILRPFNYIGAGQANNFLVPKIVDHFVRGERSITLGNLALVRDFSDVEDVVEAYVRLLQGSPVSKTGPINLASGRGVALGRILEIMADLSGYEPEIVRDPALVRPGEPRKIIGSRERLEEVAGVWPLKSLETTLAEMLAAGRKARL